MDVVRDAILPLVLIGALGWVLRSAGFLTVERRLTLEVLVYYLLLPVLLVTRLAQADYGAGLLLPIAAGVVVPLLAMAALITALRLLPGASWLDGGAYAAVLQGAIRNNTFVSLALAEAVLGERGALYVALAVLCNVPVANLLSIGALLRAAPADGAARRPGVLLPLLRNPFILASAAGLAIGLAGLRLPAVVLRAGDLLSSAVLPLVLLAVGAGVAFPAIRGRVAALAFATCARLALMPLLAFAVCGLLGLSPELTLALVLYHAAPTATASYVLTRQLGGDGDLMAAIISLQTVLAAVTIPAVLLLLF